MSKNLLIPSCIAAMVLSGGLAGFCALQYSAGVNADRYYGTQASTLQSSALNTITLSMRAATDASYIGQVQQMAAQVDSSLGSLRRGSSTAGITPLPAMGSGNLDHFEASWGKVLTAIQQIASSRGNNTTFERLSGESSQLASNLISEATSAIDRIESSPLVDSRIKEALVKAKTGLVEGVELLANTSSPNSDSLNLALEASKMYLATLAAIGRSMPRESTLVDPLLKSFRTAQNLSRTTIKAIEAASGTVDNAPHARAIWAERENIEAALNGLHHSIAGLPKSRLISPMIMLGSVGLSLVIMLCGVTLILRESRAHTRQAESMANNIQSSQKERSQELRQLIEEMLEVGQGDLTVHFSEGNNSTNEIASTLNTVFPKFREIVQDVQQTIASLSAASEQTLSMARNTERSRNEQVQAIQHIAKLVEELNSFTKQLDGVINRTRESSLAVSTQITTGSSAVQEVHEGVVKLSQSNLNIMHHAKAMTENIQTLEHLVDVVRRVANQAATVAYNAHLVADAITDDDLSKRIRISAEAMSKLTSSATEAAEQIATNLQGINVAAKDTQFVLEESQTEIKALTGMSANALKAMNAIRDQTNQLVEGIISVAGQTADLNSRSDEVADTMEKIHHYASDHSSASEQTATAISNLNAQAQRVGTTLSQFNV
jgi:methyl-accepting chemotaxis protein